MYRRGQQCLEILDINSSKVEQYVYHKRHLAEMPGLHVRITTTQCKKNSSRPPLTNLNPRLDKISTECRDWIVKSSQVRRALKTLQIFNYTSV